MMKYPALIFACVCAASATPAFAKQCPAGQILRVSKGVCVNKAAAIKDGVVVAHSGRHTGKSIRVARAEPLDAAPAKARGRTIVEKSAPADEPQIAQNYAETPARPARPEPFAAAPPAVPAPSPFGALRLDYFK